jgi:Zn-dependent metalloprotease
MKGSRSAAALVLLAILALLLATAPTHAAPRQRGQLLAAYRETGQARPAWAQQALDRSLAGLSARGFARGTLRLRGADRDDLATHVRLDQTHRGVPVFGGQLVAHLAPTGTLTSVSGRYHRGLTATVTPRVTAATAVARARSGLGGALAATPSTRLVVLPAGRGLLAWLVTLQVDDGSVATGNWQAFVDAASGRLLSRYNQADTATGTGNSLYSGTVTIGTEQTGTGFVMRDGARGGLETRDMFNKTSGAGTIFTDADNVWGDGTNADRQSAGVDAHFGAAQTWDYYLNTFGRRGIDGNGFPLISRVHYGKDYNNAFWNGSVMTYGDGDGAFFRPLVAIDVAGHEITHGLTQFTANLIYARESGASNESFSDIFGTVIEFYTGAVGGRTPDYLIGEDILIPADTAPGIRNMVDPTEDGDPSYYPNRLYPGKCNPNPSNDNCGVHSNSGIQNHAFYLLAEGGTHAISGVKVKDIGQAAAAAIFYRALTVYLFPSATFHDVRVACISAAADLFGANSMQVRSTTDAWTAVGVA